MEIQAFKKRFDVVLEKRLKRTLKPYAELTQDAFILEVLDYTQKLVLLGGKRVRPYMAWLAYKACGGKRDAYALEVFAGLELFHAFALVHDDVMDRGTERHGMATSHVYVEQRMRKMKREGDLAHLGEAQAILVGDLLFAWAANQIAGTTAWPVFRRMVDEVMIGQMIDVDVMTRDAVHDQLLNEKMRLKTASYSFVRPMQLGAALAGKNAKMMRFCEAYGFPLGMAFQIQDDLLDITTPSSQTGKTAFSDLRDGQHTIFTQYISHHPDREMRQALERFWKKPLTEKDRPRVIELFESSGAFAHGKMLIEGYFQEATEALDRARFPAAHAKAFHGLIEYIRGRGV